MQKICKEPSYWSLEMGERVLIFFKAGPLAIKVIWDGMNGMAGRESKQSLS